VEPHQTSPGLDQRLLHKVGCPGLGSKSGFELSFRDREEIRSVDLQELICRREVYGRYRSEEGAYLRIPARPICMVRTAYHPLPPWRFPAIETLSVMILQMGRLHSTSYEFFSTPRSDRSIKTLKGKDP
jgi:hypothetical protein